MATAGVHDDLELDGGGIYPIPDPPSQEVVRLKEELSRVNCLSQKDKLLIEDLQMQLNQQTGKNWMVQHELSCLKEKFDNMSKSYGQTKTDVLVMLFHFMCHVATCCPQIKSLITIEYCNELKKVVDEFNIGEIKEKIRVLYDEIQSRLLQITACGGSLDEITTKCCEYIDQCFSGINSICDERLMADFIEKKLTGVVIFDRQLNSPCWSGARAVIDIPSTSCCSLWTMSVMLSHAFKSMGEVWISKQGIPIVAKATGMSEDQVKEHFCYTQTGDGKDTLGPLLVNGLIRPVSSEMIRPNQQEDDLAVFFTRLLLNLMIIPGEVFMLSVSQKGESPGHCLPCVITQDRCNIACGCDSVEFANVSSLSAYVLEKKPFAKLIDLPTDSDA